MIRVLGGGHCSCDDIFNANDVGRRHGSLWARYAHADIADVLASMAVQACIAASFGRRCVGAEIDEAVVARASAVGLYDEDDCPMGIILGHDQGSTTWIIRSRHLWQRSEQ
ncbi:hypothetical protein ACLOJK_014909 [Asimina triloba]